MAFVLKSFWVPLSVVIVPRNAHFVKKRSGQFVRISSEIGGRRLFAGKVMVSLIGLVTGTLTKGFAILDVAAGISVWFFATSFRISGRC